MTTQPLRIGIDMAATVGQKTGFGFYVENIVRALHALPESNERMELIEIKRIKKNLRTPTRIVWDQIGVPLSALLQQVDLLWVPAFSAPYFPKPVVMTAHDIYGRMHPEQFTGPARLYWSRLLPESMKHAQHILCVSEYTKQTIEKELEIAPERMSVVPLAASEEFRCVDDVEWIKQHLKGFGLKHPFLLHVGTLEPRKNIGRLLEAFAFAERGGTQLVLVGKRGWEYEEVFEKIRKYHLEKAVKYVEYVTMDQLVALYNACIGLVVPSVFEGFGLPALEAMQCGAAVAVAYNTSLPEVTGEAGVVFDPYDVHDIRARLNVLLTNEELRMQMQRQSIERAKQFSWKKTAEQTVEILCRVAQESHTL